MQMKILADKENLTQPPETTELQNEGLFSDIRYICNSTNLITESLQKGFDVAQLPNGDIIVTEIKTVNVQYSWNKTKQKMVKVSQI